MSHSWTLGRFSSPYAARASHNSHLMSQGQTLSKFSSPSGYTAWTFCHGHLRSDGWPSVGLCCHYSRRASRNVNLLSQNWTVIGSAQTFFHSRWCRTVLPPLSSAHLLPEQEYHLTSQGHTLSRFSSPFYIGRAFTVEIFSYTTGPW